MLCKAVGFVHDRETKGVSFSLGRHLWVNQPARKDAKRTSMMGICGPDDWTHFRQLSVFLLFFWNSSFKMQLNYKRQLWWKQWFLLMIVFQTASTYNNFTFQFMKESQHFFAGNRTSHPELQTAYSTKTWIISLFFFNMELTSSCHTVQRKSIRVYQIAFSANSGFMCASMVKNSCVLGAVSYCSYWPWHVANHMDESKPVDQSGFVFLPQKNSRLLWFRTFMNFPNDSPLSERTAFGEIFTGSSHWQSTGAPSWMEPLHDTNDFWV